MPVTKRQLAASIWDAHHIEDRGAIAAFILDDATEFGPNPFRCTSAGAQRQTWSGRTHEFRSLGIQFAGLSCLLQALVLLPTHEPLEQEILRGGPFIAYVYHHAGPARIVGAVLHGKPGIPLPVTTDVPYPQPSRRGRPRKSSAQLDLFATAHV
ncbi:hypothetical protein F6X53_28375 [Methylobacterium soli]|uniref:Uncharacterized protein n=1 Tax=Methylobacterium soli TaxID=553447 RepID=A0A6L3STM8_9HYPH|nr:hypothetical protein F6X53_28375 [Methylobacterium soli]